MANTLTYREYFENETGLRAPIEMSVSAIFQDAAVCQCYTCHEQCLRCWGDREENPILRHDYEKEMKDYEKKHVIHLFRPAAPDSTYLKHFEKQTGLKAPIAMPVIEIFSSANFCNHCSFNNSNNLCQLCWTGCEDDRRTLVSDYTELMRRFRTNGHPMRNCYGIEHPTPNPSGFTSSGHASYLDLECHPLFDEYDVTLLPAEQNK